MNTAAGFNKTAMSAGFIVFAAVLVLLGPAGVAEALKGARYPYVAATAAAFCFGSVVRIYKWSLMRDRVGAAIGTRRLVAIFFSSKFWGTVSPMRTGEVAPVFISGCERGRLLSMVVYDRVVESFQTLMVFGALFFVFYGVFFGARTGFVILGVSAALAGFSFVLFSRRAGLYVLGLLGRALARAGGGKTASGARRFLSGVNSEMGKFYDAAAGYFSPGFSAVVLSLTFVSWAGDLMLWALIFKAVGADAPLVVVATSVVVFQMVNAMAPIPGGLGAGDLGLAVVLKYFGYGAEVGGIIVLVRAVSLAYIFASYLIFSAAAERRPEAAQ